MTGHRNAALGALSTLVVLVALAPAGSAASLRLTGGPPSGHIATAGAGGVVIPLRWEADTTGCTVPAYAPPAAEVVVGVARGPRPFRGVLAQGTAPSGAGEMRYSRPAVRERYSWYLSLSCPGIGELRTPARTITILPPDPRPRLEGRWALTFRSATGGLERRTFRIRPDCPSGPCAGRDGAGRRWVANLRTGAYALRWSEPAACVAADGRFIPRGVIRARTAAMTVVRKRLVGTTVLAIRMTGRWRAVERLTARGRRAGCRPEHASGRLIAVPEVPPVATGRGRG